MATYFRRSLGAPVALALLAGSIGLGLAGCATTNVTPTQRYQGPALARPDRILIYDFAASPADLPKWSAAAAAHHYASTASAEELSTGRKLGHMVAQELIEDINGMGMTAVQAETSTPPRIGDLVIVGYFAAVDEGSTMKRIVVGFGSGNADLKTSIEGYLMTEKGLRLLGSGDVDAGGGKAPGMVVPLAVTVATANPIGLIVGGAVKATGEVTGRTTIEGSAERTAETVAAELKKRFEAQGWI